MPFCGRARNDLLPLLRMCRDVEGSLGPAMSRPAMARRLQACHWQGPGRHHKHEWIPKRCAPTRPVARGLCDGDSVVIVNECANFVVVQVIISRREMSKASKWLASILKLMSLDIHATGATSKR